MKHPAPRPFEVSRETRVRLDTFFELLKIWNPRINLVGRGDVSAWWSRHIEDSLQLGALLPEADGPVGDLGTGGGMPGLVLAASDELSRPFHLVESDQRKCAFLREVVRAAGLSRVTVHATRIEDAVVPPLAAVTARALAPLPELLGHAHRLLRPGGVAIFPKGRNAEAELTAAAPHWHMAVERFTSRTSAEATIFRIRDLRPA